MFQFDPIITVISLTVIVISLIIYSKIHNYYLKNVSMWKSFGTYLIPVIGVISVMFLTYHDDDSLIEINKKNMLYGDRVPF